MPYIDDADRKYIDDSFSGWVSRCHVLEKDNAVGSYGVQIDDIANLIRCVPSGKIKGAFNYFTSRLWSHVFQVEQLGYTGLSDAIAVFNDMSCETRRRLMDPYEDKCIKKNGDLPEWML